MISKSVWSVIVTGRSHCFPCKVVAVLNFRSFLFLDQSVTPFRVHIHSNQFGFMPGRGTIDPIFILRQVQEKILEGNRTRYWTFVDLEKAFDRVPREALYWGQITKKNLTTILR